MDQLKAILSLIGLGTKNNRMTVGLMMTWILCERIYLFVSRNKKRRSLENLTIIHCHLKSLVLEWSAQILFWCFFNITRQLNQRRFLVTIHIT